MIGDPILGPILTIHPFTFGHISVSAVAFLSFKTKGFYLVAVLSPLVGSLFDSGLVTLYLSHMSNAL